jgi:hypothetical protein
MKTSMIAGLGSLALVASADAGLAGFVAFSRNVGGNTVIDVFAVTTNASDKFLNVYDTVSNGTFVQKAGLSSKTWKPDRFNFTSTRAVSDDSFMTAGTFDGGAYGGEFYASSNSNADPNFTGTSWSATPASPAATTIPNDAGWYTGDPTSVDNNAELMSTWATGAGATRANSTLVSAAGGYNAPANSNAATHGIWISHLVLAGNNKVIGTDFTFRASASIKDGVNGATTQATYQLPSPGPAPDTDNDGRPDATDNCPSVANPNQADADADTRGDACDNCVNDANSSQTNSDHDEQGDACDLDDDDDGITDAQDNCPLKWNQDQLNNDNDSQGDACDSDDDNDGVADMKDNCPTVVNPGQSDCDNDDIGDACQVFVDCNDNGRSDQCDIDIGSSTDFDLNQVPDDCQPDCNLNGLPDAWECSTGRAPDCNANLKPDTCEGAVLVSADSGNLGAPSGDETRSHTFAFLPFAESGVTVTVDVSGDLNGTTEWIEVSVDGGAPRRFLEAGGNSCPATPDRVSFQLTRAEFTAMMADDRAVTVTVSCPVTVDPTECKGAGLTAVNIAYVGVDPIAGDCNSNNRLDVCEVAEGLQPDCNGNELPDSCDIARGKSGDCDTDGLPDECEIAANPALDCDANAVLDSCDLAIDPSRDCDRDGKIDSCELAAGTDADCNANAVIDSCDILSRTSDDIDSDGRPDECQTVFVPGDFATIQAAIDAAPTGEMRIVKLGAGTYPGPVAFNGKPVVLRGAGASATTVSGTAGQVVSVIRLNGEPAIAAVESLRVTGGLTGTNPSGTSFLVGGGIFAQDSAARLRNCVIEGNTAGFGGGAYFLNCTGMVMNTEFRGNSTTTDGGGVQANQGAMRFIDVTVTGNHCNSCGGGMHLVQGLPELLRVSVTGNSSDNLMGGVSWFAQGSPTAELTMTGCTVTGNAADFAQGDIGVTDSAGLVPSLTLAGTSVCSNLPRPNIAGRWNDEGGNVVCDCPSDVNLDGQVNGADLSLVLSNWGPCAGACLYDLNRDGVVNGSDLAAVLSNWGPCGD